MSMPDEPVGLQQQVGALREQTEPGNPAVAVALVRVSTRGQELGPEVQRQMVNKWAHDAGVRIVSWHHETMSGAADIRDRDVLLNALVALKLHCAGVLVVAKRDRLARSVLSAALIEEMVHRAGAKIVCANGEAPDDGTPESEFVRTIVDAVAAFERARIAIRTKEALALKKENGECVGQVPYGYVVGPDGKTLVPVEGERKVIELVNCMVREGHPLKAVAAELTRRDWTPRKRRPWRQNQLRRMLTLEEARTEWKARMAFAQAIAAKGGAATAKKPRERSQRSPECSPSPSPTQK